MIEERLGLAQISSNLTWGPHEKQVDLIVAIGMASTTQYTKLGAHILRLLVTNDAKAFSDARNSLAVWACNRNKRISKSLAEKLAFRALEEIVAPGCVSCLGTGVAIIQDKKVACPRCSGSGRHVFSPHERAKSLGMKMDRYREVGENWLEMTISRAMGSYDAVVRGANKRR